MKLSALVAQVGPQLIDFDLCAAKTGMPAADLREMFLAFVLTLQEKESDGDRISRSKFVASLAADIMRTWTGGATRDAARLCVELAHLIAAESYRACKEPF
jgi:hypothetical protein